MVLGDSISDIGASGVQDTWFAVACARSKQRILYAGTAATPSHTSTQALARIADVTDQAPDFCFVLIGANDSVAATLRANVVSIVTALRTAGVEPILCTLLPQATQTFVQAHNSWLRAYAAEAGLSLVDFYAALSSTTGGWVAAYTSDNTHPTTAGLLAMAEAVLTSGVVERFPANRPRLASTSTDAANIMGDGIFSVDSNADGVADGWVATGGATTYSLVTDPKVKGNWQRLTRASAAEAQSQLQRSGLTSGFSVGDAVSFAGRLSIRNPASGLLVYVSIGFVGPNTFAPNPVYAWEGPVTDAVFYGETTIPTGTTSILCNIQASTGTGSVEVAELTITNLTLNGRG